ncbi:MAG: pantetheine-phosphate adenylyltransferase [Magnetovibrionaceae bacterium]
MTSNPNPAPHETAAPDRAHRGVYPGTFDPPTNGHMDIIRRATRLVDNLIVGVAANPAKAPLFSLEDRCSMVRAEINRMDIRDGTLIEVVPFDNLLMDFVMQQGANVIVRGLRAVSDFEYEFQMAGMNARLNRSVETVFLMASDRHQFISSRFVKEIGRLNGDISEFVSADVREILMERFRLINGKGRGSNGA